MEQALVARQAYRDLKKDYSETHSKQKISKLAVPLPLQINSEKEVDTFLPTSFFCIGLLVDVLLAPPGGQGVGDAVHLLRGADAEAEMIVQVIHPHRPYHDPLGAQIGEAILSFSR